MLNKNADKEYLATKVGHYLEQGDMVMAERFLEAYLPIVGCARDEVMKMVKQPDKTKKNVKKGDE